MFYSKWEYFVPSRRGIQLFWNRQEIMLHPTQPSWPELLKMYDDENFHIFCCSSRWYYLSVCFQNCSLCHLTKKTYLEMENTHQCSYDCSFSQLRILTFSGTAWHALQATGYLRSILCIQSWLWGFIIVNVDLFIFINNLLACLRQVHVKKKCKWGKIDFEVLSI